jgi:hypothetical protein
MAIECHIAVHGVVLARVDGVPLTDEEGVMYTKDYPWEVEIVILETRQTFNNLFLAMLWKIS